VPKPLHETAVEKIDDAAFDLQQLSVAYSGRLAQLLYNLASDVGDRVRRAKREIAEQANQNGQEVAS
jgi:hypothetical protein